MPSPATPDERSTLSIPDADASADTSEPRTNSSRPRRFALPPDARPERYEPPPSPSVPVPASPERRRRPDDSATISTVKSPPGPKRRSGSTNAGMVNAFSLPPDSAVHSASGFTPAFRALIHTVAPRRILLRDAPGDSRTHLAVWYTVPDHRPHGKRNFEELIGARSGVAQTPVRLISARRPAPDAPAGCRPTGPGLTAPAS